MTIERAKSELMQIYGALSPDKQRAIDTLVKMEPCEDAISRQAVINLIRRCNSALEEPRIFESHHSGNIFEHYITKLPSVNPQEPKYCDRNICIKNEYNGIGCDECEVTKSQEPKIGHWIEVTNGRGGHECSLCHEYAPSYQSGDEWLTKYCPNCGTKMAETEE